MTQFSVHPTIQICDTCQELANTYDLGPQDLLFTNDFLFDPYFAPLDLKCPVLFQESMAWASRPMRWSRPFIGTCPRTSLASSPWAAAPCWT